jgi:hypothetical protein
MLVDAEIVIAGAVMVAASTLCVGDGITGICQTAPLLTIL